MRLKWTGAITLAVATVFALVTPAPAGAHSYTGTYTYRLYSCEFNGKACQSHYLEAVDSSLYGPLWKVKHTHGCTGYDDVYDTYDMWAYWDFDIREHTGSVVWTSSHENAHNHTSKWCGWSAGTHSWYPNVYVPRGDNTFWIRTATHLDGADPNDGWYYASNWTEDV